MNVPAIALITALAVPAAAQAEQVVLRCFFDWRCDPNTKCDHAGEDVRFRLDIETKTVSRIGGNDISEFELLIGDRAITVLERPISGGSATTTIMNSNGDAVHSENLITGRDLTPMQYLGNCIAS